MIEKLNYPHIGILILAWFVADIAFPAVIALGRRIGALDRPHAHKAHEVPVPFLGGLGILLAVAIAITSILRFDSFLSIRPLFGIVLGALVLLAVGGLDDLRPISALVKLLLVLLTTGILFAFGVQVNLFHSSWWVLNLALTVLWIAGVISAMNSLDNTDGVAGGTSAIAAAAIFWIAWRNYALVNDPGWQQTQKVVSYLSAAVLGGCLGFLRYNFTPAVIYLGNNGSFLLGFLLAALTVVGGWSVADPVRSFLVQCSILAVPLFDITMVTILRYRRGIVRTVREAILHCGRDHTAHRLRAFGFSVRETSLLLYLFGVVAAAVGVYISDPRVPRAHYLPAGLLSIAGLVIAGVILDRAPVYPAHAYPATAGTNGIPAAVDTADPPGKEWS